MKEIKITKSERSFRPLIGVSFCKLLMDDLSVAVEYLYEGFRPLIGVSFCKLGYGPTERDVLIGEFPSPYRG